MLTIPVKSQGGLRTLLRDIRLSEDTPWRRNHWHGLRSAYGRSPFFLHVADDLRMMLEDRSIRFLLDFSMQSIALLERLAGPLPDLSVQAGGCVAPPREWFEPAGPRPQPDPYPQVFSGHLPFVNDLSMLDMVMNLGPAAAGRLHLLKIADEKPG